MLDKFRSFSRTIFAKILFGVLLVSFVVWGVGNIGQARHAHIAAFVGDDIVTIRDLQVTYSQELGRVRQAFGNQISEQQMKQLGLLQRALNTLVIRSLLAQAAHDMGITTGKDAIIRKLRQDPTFQTADGKFDTEKFKQLLESNNMTEAQFIELISSDLNREQFTSSLFGGITADKVLLKFYQRFSDEIREGKYVEIVPASLSVASSSEEDIKKFYNEHKDSFVTPEYRSFSYVTLNQKEITDSVSVSDDDVKKFYESNKKSFEIPEQRDLTQLIFADENAVKKAAEFAAKGEDFAGIVQRFTQEDAPKLVNVNKASKSDLLTELQEPIFSANKDAVIGPFKTALGWHIVKVKTVYQPRMRPLEEVSGDIKTALKTQKSADAFYDVGNRLDDTLASGAKLSDAAKELGLTVQTVSAVTRNGKKADAKDTFDKAEILSTAFSLSQPGEASSLQELNAKDGYFVVQIDDIVKPNPKSLDEVKESIVAALKQQAQWAAAEDKLQKLLAAAAEKKSLAKASADMGLELKAIPAQKRADANKDLGPQGINTLFEIQSKGMTGYTRLPDRLLAIEATDIKDGKNSLSDDERTAALENLKQQNATILFDELRAELLKRYKVKVNDKAIKAAFN